MSRYLFYRQTEKLNYLFIYVYEEIKLIILLEKLACRLRTLSGHWVKGFKIERVHSFYYCFFSYLKFLHDNIIQFFIFHLKKYNINITTASNIIEVS